MVLAAGEGGMSMGFLLIYFVFFAVLMYFMAIRPQQKEKKKMQDLLSNVAIGDAVRTTGGFYGTIIDMTDDMVIIEFGNDRHCRIPMQKQAIAEIEKPET